MTTYYIADQHNSIIRNEADSASLAAENGDVADHPKATNFILCCQCNYSNSGACNKATAATSLKLQYNKDGGATWYDVTAVSEIAYANVSGLTNDSTAGTARCTSTPTGCTGAASVKDCEDGAVTSTALAAEAWQELKFGLSPANAVAGVKYAFRLYDVTNSVAVTGTNANYQAEVTIYIAADLSIAAVFDAVAAEDELGTVADNENLGPVDVFDATSVTEDIAAEQPDTTVTHAINIFDAITVAEWYKIKKTKQVYKKTPVAPGIAYNDRDSRNAIPSGSLNAVEFANLKVRVELCASASGSCNIQGCSIGKRDSGIAYVESTITRITFNNGSDSIVIPENSTVWSDWVDYPYYDETADLLVHIHNHDNIQSDTIAGVTCYFKFYGTDETMTVAPTGYSTASDFIVGLSAIEGGEDSDEYIFSAYVLYINKYEAVSVTDEASFFFDNYAINKFETVSISEFITTASSDLGIDQFDSITLEEFSEFDSVLDANIFDSVSVTEDVTIINALANISVYDSIIATDKVPIYQIIHDTLVDVTISQACNFDVYDTVSVTEDITSQASLADVSVFDTITLSEEITISLGDIEAITFDSTVVAEDIAIALSDIDSNVYDSATVSESITSAADLAEINVFDATSLEDIPTVVPEGAIVHLNISGINDLVGITEEVTLSLSDLTRSVYDEISTSELVESSIELAPINVSDAVTISEYTQLLNELTPVEVSDTITISEDIVLTVDIAGINLSDTITIAESTTSTVDIPGIDVYDSITLADIPTVQVGSAALPVNISDVFETVTISELVTSSLSDLARSVYDSVTLAEFVQAAINIAGINVYDTVTLEESSVVSVSVPSSIQISEVYETVTISELSTVSVPDLYGSTYDTISINENIEVAPDVVVSISDIVTVSEQVSIHSPVEMSIFDTSGISESVSVILDYGVNVSDVVNVRELVSGVGGDLSSSVFDTVSISDWGYIYWLLAAGRLEVNCEGLGISVDTLGFMDRIGVDGIEIDIEALGI